MNKISYFLTYHGFLFYISKLLCVTVILYFLHSFSFIPRRRFVFQAEMSDKYIALVLISVLFYFFSSLRRGGQSTVFCIVSFDFNWSRSPKIRHHFALVCRGGLADITRVVCRKWGPGTRVYAKRKSQGKPSNHVGPNTSHLCQPIRAKTHSSLREMKGQSQPQLPETVPYSQRQSTGFWWKTCILPWFFKSTVLFFKKSSIILA